MKKTWVVVLCLILTMAILAGCNSGTQLVNESGIDDSSESSGSSSEDLNIVPPLDAYSNFTEEIYDANEQKMGELSVYMNLALTDDSLIYSQLPAATQQLTEFDYYRYVFATKQNIKLGTVKEPSYPNCDQVLLNGHLYFEVMTGPYTDVIAPALNLMDIDLSTNSLRTVFTEPDGYLYDCLTTDGERLFLSRMYWDKDNDDVEEYNPTTGERNIFKTYDRNYQTQAGDVVRQISADKNTISVLVAESQDGKTNSGLRIDQFDHDMNFLRSVDMTPIISYSFPDFDPNDLVSELGQPVFGFFATNSYVYYENRGVTRFIGKITADNTIQPITDMDLRDFFMASEAGNPDTTNVFMNEATNDVYLLNQNDGTLKHAIFNTEGTNYSLINGLKSPDGKLFLDKGYYNANGRGADYSPIIKAYYINQSDLDFQ